MHKCHKEAFPHGHCKETLVREQDIYIVVEVLDVYFALVWNSSSEVGVFAHLSIMWVKGWGPTHFDPRYGTARMIYDTDSGCTTVTPVTCSGATHLRLER
jgi:hypothetical protein